MSTTKRSRGRQSETGATPSLPPNKKAKTSKDTATGLSFLTDENKRAGRTLSANPVNGAKNPRANRIDESQAVIGNRETDAAATSEVVEISSDESSEYESSGDEAEDAQKQLTNGMSDKDTKAGADDVAMADAESDDETGPSFGHLLQASHPETIDVQAAFSDRNADAQALAPIDGNRVLAAPSATSLGTVLTQALRTNDKDLLESCFQSRDTPSIRSTIQRLQSPLVADLLTRLAERLYKRPGRAGSLMVWVQWSLVAHGGYLASQPQLLKKLKALQQVIKERANGLASLMTLKGKLDMLSAQLELRQAMHDDNRATMYDEDDEDPNVVYIEGQDDESSDDDGVAPRKQKKLAYKRSAENSDDDDDMPMTNGFADLSGDESNEDDDDDLEGGLIDDEAEVTSDEEGEDSEDDDDEDEDVSEEDVDESASEDEGPPPVRPPKPQRSSISRR